MEPILVPGPPKEAFNKHRLISDLVKKQVEHFKHVEEKLPPDVRASLPQHDVVTESDAARYIAAMTSYLLSRPGAALAKIAKKAPKRPVAMPARPALALAAAAEAPTRKKKASIKKTAAKKKKTAAKKQAAARKKPAAKKSLSAKSKARSSSRKRMK